MSLSLIIFFALKSILSDINIVYLQVPHSVAFGGNRILWVWVGKLAPHVGTTDKMMTWHCLLDDDESLDSPLGLL